MVSRLTLSIIISASERGFRAFTKAETGLKGLLAATKAVQVALAALVAVPIIIGVTKSIAAFKEFDLAMKQFQAITRSTGDVMGDVTGLARELGKSTVFTATEVANAMFFMAQAGLTTDEVMNNVINTLRLAQIGQLDLGLASDIVTDIMAGYNIQADQMGRVTDILVTTFSNFNTTVEGLGAAFSFTAQIATTLGVSIEEIATAIGFLSSAGVKGERAGTTLRRVFFGLAEVTVSGRKALEAYGVSAFDAQGNFTSLSSALEQFSDLQKRISQQEFLQLIGKVFGLRGASILTLIDAFDKAEDGWTDFLGVLSGPETEGAAKAQTDIIDSSLDATMKRIKAFLTDIGISLGKALAPVFDRLEKFFRDNEKEIGTLGNLMVQLLPVLALVGELILGIVSLLLDVVHVLGPILKIGAQIFVVIMSIVPGILVWIGHLITVSSWWEKIASFVNDIRTGFRDIITNPFSNLLNRGTDFFGAPEIFQHGGMVANTGLFRLERGEEVLPAAARLSAGGGGGGQTVVNNTFNVILNRMDAVEFEQMVLRGMNRVERR